jgi:endonuclease YncB( thermonuclease family)
MRRTLCLALLGLLAFVSAALRGGAWRVPPDPAELRRERVAREAIEIRDGDTFVVDGRELRLLGADTPERAAPWFDGDQEPWATRASDLVRRQLDGAETIELVSRGHRGPYARELVHVLCDGRPLAVELVAAGLAVETVSAFGDGGFPEIAEQVLRRARPVAFETPYRWRRKHRTD